MSRPKKFSLAILDRLEHRFRKSRPDPVLILVVALLVLLALLGTAFINTSQSDRYSSSQNQFNTEVDLLLQGVENITEAQIVNALFGTNNAFHQELGTNGKPTGYAASDYPLNKQSAFIGDRYPSYGGPQAPVANYPYWQFVSSLPNVPNFESPYTNTSVMPAAQFDYNTRTQMIPTYVQIQQNSGGNSFFPAFIYSVTTTPTSGMPTTAQYLALAGDADGDGVADCPLFRLSVGQINGVTYYGGVRIIDNSAAINAAIAWQPNGLAGASGTIPGNLYPDNVDLFDLLISGDTLANLNSYRFGVGSGGMASLVPIDDRPTAPTGGPPPTQPTPMQRTDFSFGTNYEAFWMQLGRRIAYPGYNTTGVQYVALPVSEMQTMARKFILRDPSIASSATSSSTLEQYLPNSVFNSAPTAPYTPTSAAAVAQEAMQWYNNNFNFASPNTMPLRSMLVTQNPVSNFTYSKLYSRGNYVSGSTYNYGDWVFNSSTTGGDNRAYVCLQQTTTAPDPTNPSNPYWEREPWVTGPTKVSANTATFGQLWMGYFSVMSNPLPETKNPIPAAEASTTDIVPTWPYGVANPPLPYPPSTPPNVYVDDPAKAMFRSSVRALSPSLSAQQMVLLRSALAAVNTLDLRDNDDDVTSRQIVLPATGGAPAYNVMVYGTEKQPYITEVYASNDVPGSSQPGPGPAPTTNGNYIAIELYNPYNVPITLTNWQMATIARSGTMTSLTLMPITTNWTGGGAPTIPAQSYIVIASSATAPSYATKPPTGTPYVVAGLSNAFNNELVILRPRNFNGTLSSSTAPTNTYDETANGVKDMVPVDSYDFTGLPSSEMDPGHEWHYIRPNLTSAGKAWHFVYPDTYDPTQNSADTPRQYGTQHSNNAQLITDLSSLGVGDATAVTSPASIPPPTLPYIDRPLQIANQDFGGPKPADSATGYPYGGFARNADLLQVTYIGAYRIEDTSGNILELNSVTMDAAMANDTLMDGDANALLSEQMGRQNIGRFTPVHWADTVTGTFTPGGSLPTPVATNGEMSYATSALWDDYGYAQPNNSTVTNWPMPTAYNWTLDLFDYLTVQAPHDDYLPDTDPLKYTAGTATPVSNSSYYVANAGYTAASQTASTNYPASATEETAPVHGRININTANWRVIATLPMFDNPYNAAAAADMAQAIVYYRDVDDGSTPGTPHPHGPFQSVDELNNVTITSNTTPTTLTAGTNFRTAFGQYLGTFTVPGLHGSNVDGDLSPYNSGAQTTVGGDQVYGDFENQNLGLNRISNLITTRSDSFTAYIIVQGWTNVNTPSPQLVVQRRATIIIDRSTITPANNTEPAITNAPAE